MNLTKARILVIDDETILRKALARYLESEGFEVIQARDGKEGLACYNRYDVDLSLIDLVMPEVSGYDVVKAIAKNDPNAVTIVMTAFGTIPSAVEAIRAGAYQYITKPFELEDMGVLIRKALQYRRVVTENIALKSQLEKRSEIHKFIGDSSSIRQIFSLIERVAETDSTVLILGESGTGKELVARAIHKQSSRADKPLVAVNCAAMPEGLLETEFFGHMKGAFTGAASNRRGRFAQADGGTIFLDEVADMSPKLQVKLLRVLQDHRFEPVGSSHSMEVDVRVIAATNQNLEALVDRGLFREDLYYRLNVIPIEVPPLRERRSDIPLLMDYFLEKFGEENGTKKISIDPRARRRLIDYRWPGNVRELENMMERIVVLNHQGYISLEDLPPHIAAENNVLPQYHFEIPESGVLLKDLIGQYEINLIRAALQKTGWNKNRAAQLLGLNRTTLIEKIKKRRIEKVG